MIGFLVGTACLFGLVRVLRGGRRFGGWRGYGPRGALRALFERLDTSPGQEKVILAAVEDLWKSKREVREEFAATRKDIARAMRGDAFDHEALNEAFARQDALKGKIREGVRQALSQVHEALDDRQRKLAGDMIEGLAGFGFARGGCGRMRGFGHYAHRHGGEGAPEGHGPYRAQWT